MKNLLKKLIRSAPVEANGELGAANTLRDYFADLNIPVEVDTWPANRANAVVRIRSTGRKPALLFGAHHDVVPANTGRWTVPPHEGVERDGRIWGRGATDMLGGLAAAAFAVAQTVREGDELQGDIILAATAGEETDSCGVVRFVESGAGSLPPLAGVILPEPTDLKVLTAHRGILWVKVTTLGRSAHGSMPHLGINAIQKANALLNELFRFQIDFPPHPKLGGSSISINRIAGGTAANIVPDRCEVEMDIRTTPGMSHEGILEKLQAILDQQKAKDCESVAELSVTRSVHALESDPDSDFVKQVCAAAEIGETGVAAFTTDGPHFRRLSENILIFGPGKPEMCHKPDEHIEIADLETAARLYQQIIRKLLC